MVRNRRIRRAVALVLVASGALLMLLTPSVPLGMIPFALGVVLELVGLAIERRDKP